MLHTVFYIANIIQHYFICIR